MIALHKNSSSLLGRAIVIIFGTFVGLMCVELFCRSPLLPLRFQWERFWVFSYPQERKLHLPDPVLGVKYAPNLDMEIPQPGGVRFHVRTNSLGFTGIGFREKPLAGSAWAVALGDSFVFGWGVELEQTWVKQLQARVGRPVVNLGVSGTCPTLYTAVLERYGLPLRPKVVFYGVFLGNDFDDERRLALWKAAGSPGRFIDFFPPSGNARKYPRLWAFHRFLFSHSVAYALVYPRLRILASRDDSWRESTKRVEDAVLRARRLAEENEAKFVVIVIPSMDLVYSELLGREATIRAQMEGPERAWLLNLCEKYDLGCVDPLPVFEARAKAGEQLYLGDGHLNGGGNQLFAETLYRWLALRGWTPTNK